MEYMYIRFAQKLNLQWVCACVFLLGMGAISYPKLVWLIPIGRGEWGMTDMLTSMLYIFGVSADVGSSL